MTVKEMLERISSHEIAEWIELLEIEAKEREEEERKRKK